MPNVTDTSEHLRTIIMRNQKYETTQYTVTIVVYSYDKVRKKGRLQPEVEHDIETKVILKLPSQPKQKHIMNNTLL